MIYPTPAQIRGARAMLDWSMVELAKSSGVSVSTIKRLEDGAMPSVSVRVLALLRIAMEDDGVQFLPDEGSGPGLRLRVR